MKLGLHRPFFFLALKGKEDYHFQLSGERRKGVGLRGTLGTMVVVPAAAAAFSSSFL